MKAKMYVIKDSCSGVCDNPFTMSGDEVAIRSFSDLVLHSDSVVSKHPEHFSLWYVGEYEPETGMVDGCAPVFVINAHDLLPSQLNQDEAQVAASQGFALNGESANA